MELPVLPKRARFLSEPPPNRLQISAQATPLPTIRADGQTENKGKPRENILAASLSVGKVTPSFLAPGLLQNATDLFETPPDPHDPAVNSLADVKTRNSRKRIPKSSSGLVPTKIPSFRAESSSTSLISEFISWIVATRTRDCWLRSCAISRSSFWISRRFFRRSQPRKSITAPSVTLVCVRGRAALWKACVPKVSPTRNWQMTVSY
jgi:hypothetical protein